MTTSQAARSSSFSPETSGSRRLRVLFLHPGPVPPSPDPRRNPQSFLAGFMDGDLLTTTWVQTDAQDHAVRERIPIALGGFGYHPLRIFGMKPVARAVRMFAHFVRTGLRLSREQGPYDAVVAYGPFTTALAALVVARRTGAAFVVDVPGHPVRGLELQGGRRGRLKARVARLVAPLILGRADGIKLLYPSQLDDLHLTRRPPTAVFHEFTPVSLLAPGRSDERFILLLGYPWYLKGVDLLIRAFLQIAERHPEHRLVVVGHCPDRTPFEKLAAGHPRIELRAAVRHEEAMTLVSRCSLLAAPSRTEGMGRVIVEAMASRKPIVASRVDGIPQIVEDGVTGLLAEPGDADDLGTKLDAVLSDPALATRLADAGYAVAHERLGERAYAERYASFLREVVARRGAGGVRA